MLIKKIKYDGLNGLSNSFTFNEKVNIFAGSNGSGKTTSLDCLAILLFGESFSYGKTLEKHIDVKNKDKAIQLEMIVETDSKIIDENGETKNVEIKFSTIIALDKKGKFSKTLYVNDVKTTREKYEEKLCNIFKIPAELLKIEKMNILRCLIDPSEIEKSDNQGIYNLVKELTNVMSLEYFINNNEEYALIRQVLAISGYDFKETQNKLKNDLKTLETKLNYIEETISKNEKEYNLEKESLDYETYNKNVDVYDGLIKKIRDLRESELKLNEKYKSSMNEDGKTQQLHVQELHKSYLEELQKNNSLEKEKNAKINEIEKFKIKINNIEWQINSLNLDIQELKNLKFEEIICQECGKVANSKDKKKFEEFNNDKLVKLKREISEAEKQLEINKVNFEESKKYLEEVIYPKLKNQEIITQEKLKKYMSGTNIVVEDSETTKALNEEIGLCLEEQNEIEKQLSELRPQLQSFNNKLNNINNINNNIIVPNKNERENLLSQKADLELKLTILNDMNIEYIKLVEKAISETFGDIQFNMIKESKNGKEKINCYAIQNEKPIYNYNTASEIAIGCKIIQAIKNKLGIKNLPILFDIVDNIGEKSLNDILKYCDGQLFCTKALFEENIKVKLINNIKENK